MSIELTEAQRQDLLKGEPVRVSVPELGREIVLLHADRFDEIREILEDEQQQAAFRAFARKQAARLARENPY